MQEPFSENNITSIVSDMNMYWPSLSGAVTDFWTHEWSKRECLKRRSREHKPLSPPPAPVRAVVAMISWGVTLDFVGQLGGQMADCLIRMFANPTFVCCRNPS
jgi:hypothetical protein